MEAHKLENYLRTYRKRAGLNQSEVAFLLGHDRQSQVSRFEKRHRVPTLRTALAWEAILGIPVAELFAGMRESVGHEIRRRLEKLALVLNEKVESKGKEAVMASRKLSWLSERHGFPLPEKQAVQ